MLAVFLVHVLENFPHLHITNPDQQVTGAAFFRTRQELIWVKRQKLNWGMLVRY